MVCGETLEFNARKGLQIRGQKSDVGGRETLEAHSSQLKGKARGDLGLRIANCGFEKA